MSLVSADNSQITSEVDSFLSAYLGFQSNLKGVLVDTLNGLSKGMSTFSTYGQALDALESSFITGQREQLLRMLGNASVAALERAETATGVKYEGSALDATEALHSAFAADLEYALQKAVRSDIKLAQDFLSVQMMAQQFTVTTRDLDLEFTVRDKAGRHLASKEYLFREANFATRKLYNSTLAQLMVREGMVRGYVDGGSKAGTHFNYEDLDKGIAMQFFHHNAKSLLQPLD